MIKIIVCDDHTILRKSISTIINAFTNCKVIDQATDGGHLLEMLKLTPTLPDVVVLDICMPNLNGYETAPLLKKLYPSIKILAFSIYNNEETIVQMVKVGATGFVLKGSNDEEMANAIYDLHTKGYHFNNYITPTLYKETTQNKQRVNQSCFSLTAKEVELLPLLCSDSSYKEIALQKKITVKTIDKHKESICQKLKVKSRIGLTAMAIRTGLLRL